MLAYVVDRPFVERKSNPQAMMLIVSAHVALIALVMSVETHMPRRIKHEPPLINVPLPPPPPRMHIVSPKVPQQPLRPISSPKEPVRVPPPPLQPPLAAETGTNGDTLVGSSGSGATQNPPEPVVSTPIFHESRLLTPQAELRPPYPASKLLSGEEAVLQLRLVINDRGHVVAVDPVGSADRVFLEAARRYLIAHWLYAPATKDGQAVPDVRIITLRFELDG